MPKRTYVDNAANRRLGRVGMPHGSCVQSSRRSYCSSPVSYSTPRGTYVDNAANRSLGRVGMPYGSCVQSSISPSSCYSDCSSVSPSGPPKTYVDSTANRSLGQVDMPNGSSVQSSTSTCTSSSDPPQTYVDNTVNRSLGRVGKPIGTGAVSEDGDISKLTPKTYVDNERNRSLDRVGKPVMHSVRQEKEKELVFTQNLDGIRRCLRDLNFCDPDYPAYFNAQHKLQHGEVEEGWQTRGITPSTNIAVVAESTEKEIIPLCDIQIEWERTIGKGGFGEVFPGLWKQGEQEKETPIAFKQFLQQAIMPKKKTQLEKEIKIFTALNHPNIVKLFGVVMEKNHLGIVMEYLPKTLFHAIFDEETKFTGHDKMRIASGTCWSQESTSTVRRNGTD